MRRPAATTDGTVTQLDTVSNGGLALPEAPGTPHVRRRPLGARARGRFRPRPRAQYGSTCPRARSAAASQSFLSSSPRRRSSSRRQTLRRAASGGGERGSEARGWQCTARRGVPARGAGAYVVRGGRAARARSGGQSTRQHRVGCDDGCAEGRRGRRTVCGCDLGGRAIALAQQDGQLRVRRLDWVVVLHPEVAAAQGGACSEGERPSQQLS